MQINNTVTRAFSVLVLGLAASLALGACADESSGGGDEVSFAVDVQPILMERCGGCHLKEANGAGKLSLGTNAELAYAALVDQTTMNTSCANLKRIDSTNHDPMQSSLFVKIVGTTCGKQMPAGMMPVLLTDVQIEVFRRWIAAGAPNN